MEPIDIETLLEKAGRGGGGGGGRKRNGEGGGGARPREWVLRVEDVKMNEESGSIPTPAYRLTVEQRRTVYEPAEDTFLLLDALEQDRMEISRRRPTLVLEVGSGSGVVSAFVAQLLARSSITDCLHMATDLNVRALAATQSTARMNGVRVETLRTDLVQALMPRLQSRVDLLLFNPPYVPSDGEAKTDEERTWAGGKDGRETLDRLLKSVPRLLSDRGLFYVVALDRNDVPALCRHFETDPEPLIGRVVLERRAGIERLFVIRFERSRQEPL